MPGVTINPLYFTWAGDLISDCVPDGNDRNMMLALQTMHSYQMDQDRAAGIGGSGVIDSEKEGDLTVSYTSVDGVSGDLNSTPWGIELSGYLARYSQSFFTRYSDVC